MSLVGQLAVVTGGSGTLGQAIGTALLEAGARVILVARNMERLQQAQRRILQVLPTREEKHCQVMSCDVTEEESVKDLFQRIDQYELESSNSSDAKNNVRFSLLVNNAGINGPPTFEMTGAQFDAVMKINVLGSFLCAREAMLRMRATSPPGGRIVQIGSLSAQSPRPNSAAYTTSKFALLGLTKSLALDGRKDNISVGIIHPGNIESELLTKEEIAKRQHEGFLAPEDVARCVLSMATLPFHSSVLEMTVLPTTQPHVGRG